jgi:hypothetical protein
LFLFWHIFYFTDLFKEVEHSQLEERGWRNLRCASFHPSDPVLACGLMDGDDGRVVLLKGLNHSVPFSNWEIERQLECEKESMYSLGWNVSKSMALQKSILYLLHFWLRKVRRNPISR